MSSKYGELSPLTAEIGWQVWAPRKFQWVLPLGFVTAPMLLGTFKIL